MARCFLDRPSYIQMRQEACLLYVLSADYHVLPKFILLYFSVQVGCPLCAAIPRSECVSDRCVHTLHLCLGLCSPVWVAFQVLEWFGAGGVGGFQVSRCHCHNDRSQRRNGGGGKSNLSDDRGQPGPAVPGRWRHRLLCPPQSPSGQRSAAPNQAALPLISQCPFDADSLSSLPVAPQNLQSANVETGPQAGCSVDEYP